MSSIPEDSLRVTPTEIPEKNPNVVRLPLHDAYYEADATVEIRYYLSLIRRRWLLIAAITALVCTVTFVLTRMVMTKYYRAEAIVRPVAEPALQGRLAGLLSSFGSFGSSGGASSAVLGIGGGGDAEQYIAILKSYPFTIAMVRKHEIYERMLLMTRSYLNKITHGLLFKFPPRYPDWAVYWLMQKRFNCEYSVRTGNITLYFEDPDRKWAERILTFYIDDLREKLRARQIQEAESAATALKEEAQSTPDSLLQSHLYELMARQIERRKLAQVQADFAFVVLVPPTAPVKPFRPRPVLDTAVAGLIALMLSITWVIIGSKSLAERSSDSGRKF